MIFYPKSGGCFFNKNKSFSFHLRDISGDRLALFYREPEPVSMPVLGILQRPEHPTFDNHALDVMLYSLFLIK